MLDPRQTSQDLAALAQQLSAADPSTAAALNDLGEAVEGNPALAQWQYATLDSVFNPEQIAQRLSPSKGGTVLSGLDLARSVLVLLPLAITWFGIAVAVNAYSALLKAEPEQASQSFIYLWQSGFGGRTELTLERLALTDVVLLTLFLVATIIHHVATGVHRQRTERELSGRRHNVQQILASADLALAAYRQPQPERFYQQNQALSDQLLVALQQQASRLEQLATARQQEIGQLTTFTSQLEHTAGEIGKASQTLGQMHANAISTLGPIANAIDLLNNRTQAIEPSLRDAALHLMSLTDGQQQSVRLIAEVAAEQQHLADQITDGMATLVEASVSVAQASLQLSEVGNMLFPEQTKLLGALASERESQVKLATMVAQSNDGVRQTAQAVKESAVNLRGIAVDLMPVAQGMPILLHQVQSGLNLMLIDQKDAAASVANATSRIDGSLAQLEHTLDELSRTVQGLTQQINRSGSNNQPFAGNQGKIS